MNPFKVVEVVLKSILFTSFALAMGLVLVVVPFVALADGKPWFLVFAPHFALVGIIVVIYVSVLIALRWDEAKSRWDRNHSAGEAARS